MMFPLGRFSEHKTRRCFSDKQQFDLAQISIQALHLPGHTKGHYGFYIEEKVCCFPVIWT
jgi:glyoxylase-like metal-dependent hydrolase (beta-lactamase superfamily II)